TTFFRSGVFRRYLISNTLPLLDSDEVLAMRLAAPHVHASPALVEYVQALLAESRRHSGVRVGLSPRAGLALLRVARARALLHERDYVLPEDVQALFEEVAGHRLVPESDTGDRNSLARHILERVAVP